MTLSRCVGFRPLFALLLLVLSPCAALAEGAADRIEVVDAYARAMPPMQPTSAMFLTLKNADAADHALVAADSTVADAVELHTHLMEDGVARMRQVERIPVPANGEVSLAPGGYHVMLIGLRAPLIEGESLSATLRFEDGSSQTVTVPIRGLGYRGAIDKDAAPGGMKCGAGKCGGGKCGASTGGGMKCGGGKCGGR